MVSNGHGAAKRGIGEIRKSRDVLTEILKTSGTLKGSRGWGSEAAIECPKEALEVWNDPGRPKKV